jgi:replicative DNA helicase
MSEALIDDSAQRLYISSMLSDPGLFARVHHLLESSYFDSSLQSTVSFMKTYFNEQRSVPPLMIVEVATKAHFDAVPSLNKNDSQYLAEQIASFCQIRAVTEAVLRAPSHIEKGSLGQMVQEIKLASQIALHSDLGIDYFDDPLGRLTESESAEVLISTGWSSVDDLTGGIGRQELILFLANSGGGKSVAKLNLAYNLLQQGLNGVHLTL